MITSGQQSCVKLAMPHHTELFDKNLGKPMMKIEMNAQLIG